MAEFCLDCANEYIVSGDNRLEKKDVITEFDLCEGCGMWKPCILKIKKRAWYKIGGRKRKWYQFWQR